MFPYPQTRETYRRRARRSHRPQGGSNDLTGCEFSAVRSFSYWPQEKATVAYESGVVRKMQRTPVHSRTQNAGDRRVFWLGCSGCTARAWSSFTHYFKKLARLAKLATS